MNSRDLHPATSMTLIELIKINDARGWENFQHLYRPAILNWCRKYGLSDLDAEEIFQETWISTRNSIAGFRREKPEDTFRGWLWTVTRRRIVDWHRKSDRANLPIVAAEFDLANLPDQPPADPDEKLQIQLRAMELASRQSYPSTTRYIFHHYRDHWSIDQIAAHYEVQPAAVRKSIARYKLRVKQILGDARTE